MPSERDALALIIPTRNRPQLLADAIDSAAGQTVPFAEVVLIDEASQPPVDVASLAHRMGSVNLRALTHATPKGGPTAKNAGAFSATASLVAFLDDDDLVAPTFVEKVLDAFAAYPTLDVLFVGVEAFGDNPDEHQRNVRTALANLLRDTTWLQGSHDVKLFTAGLTEHLFRSVPMAFQRPVVRRDVFVRSGGLRPIRTWWDGEWAIRVAAAGANIGLLDLELQRWRVSGQGFFTGKDSARSVFEIEIEIKERLREELAATGHRQLALHAASEAHLEYAYFLLVNRLAPRTALRSWLRAMQYRPRLHGVRMLASGAARGLLGSFQRT